MFEVYILYKFRSDGLTIVQPHIGYDRELGLSVYLVILNILLFDIAFNPFKKTQNNG
jgi:hypothetical protein